MGGVGRKRIISEAFLAEVSSAARAGLNNRDVAAACGCAASTIQFFLTWAASAHARIQAADEAAEALVLRIRGGELAPGDMLPGPPPTTVAKRIKDLRAEAEPDDDEYSYVAFAATLESARAAHRRDLLAIARRAAVKDGRTALAMLAMSDPSYAAPERPLAEIHTGDVLVLGGGDERWLDDGDYVEAARSLTRRAMARKADARRLALDASAAIDIEAIETQGEA